MPATKVVFYKELDGGVPVLDWLKELKKSNHRAYEGSVAAIQRLSENGHELRRPLADTLREGMYELRIRSGKVNFRILYFFAGRNIAILAHALTKVDRLPNTDIERAVFRMRTYKRDPIKHSYVEE